MAVNFTGPDIRYLHEKSVLEVWEWIAALDAFDFADPEPLESLLSGDDAIPEFMRKPLADIVAGKRKPNRKAAAKLKIPAKERMKLGATISGLLGLMDNFKGHMIDPDLHLARPACEIMADRSAIEVIDALKKLEADRREVFEMVIQEFDVSQETVENLLRDVREKIINFPDI